MRPTQQISEPPNQGPAQGIPGGGVVPGDPGDCQPVLPGPVQSHTFHAGGLWQGLFWIYVSWMFPASMDSWMILPQNALITIPGTQDVQTFTRFSSPDSVWEGLLVSCGCSNKGPCIEWFKTTHINYFTVL